ncbi:death ligand signal enhancer [Microcaecilia unicolor]|uniref:DAP3-binding cell death enhancer 1 n=1 Tax=Microcaecilia unicolor TaxID=1415580 RepID=A0A6P7YVL5_9AMPH|nr:death ligand signal enhancer [Microcaecilia unicolor]
MWRLPGLLNRVLHRFHLPNNPSSVHVTPGPHSETEVLNSSSLLHFGQSTSSKSSQNEQDQNDKRQHKTFKSFQRQQPQYTALDAFGWGAVAVVFLQLARQGLFQGFLQTHRERGLSWNCSLNKILDCLLQHQVLRSQIVPNQSKALCLNSCSVQELVSDHFSISQSGNLSPDNSSSSRENATQFSPEEEELLFISGESTRCGHGQEQDTRDEPSLEESLEDAASRLQEVSQMSVSVVLNILGIENARNGDLNTAFSCFQAAADRGYSKAQYNIGVCYEQGKGVAKDTEKAVKYYQLAASHGHSMALYRYARHLLHHKANTDAKDTEQALTMLRQAAEAGLKEAQAYLGVLYTKALHFDPQKAVKYLWLAAENGDSQSRYHLGVCYESGFGVQQNQQEAVKHYERAAAVGNNPAQQMLKAICQKQLQDVISSRSSHLSLRTTSSSPCLSSLDRIKVQLQRPAPGQPTYPQPSLAASSPAFYLPHSWSTGSLSGGGDSPAAAYMDSLVPQTALNVLPLSSLRAIGVG